jgi:hypothetical protein
MRPVAAAFKEKCADLIRWTEMLFCSESLYVVVQLLARIYDRARRVMEQEGRAEYAPDDYNVILRLAAEAVRPTNFVSWYLWLTRVAILVHDLTPDHVISQLFPKAIVPFADLLQQFLKDRDLEQYADLLVGVPR